MGSARSTLLAAAAIGLGCGGLARPPACEGLDYCACKAEPACEVVSDGCLCPCDFGCPSGCVCACGGGTYLGCRDAEPAP